MTKVFFALMTCVIVVGSAMAEDAGEERRTMLHECIENVLGYDPPGYDKPFKAHRHIQENWDADS